MTFRLGEMSHREAADYAEIIFPTGSMEQHGFHLPIGTDSIIAERICEELAERKGIAMAPTLVFGFSGEHSSFPGTIDIGLDAFTSVVQMVVSSLTKTFERIYIVNFHGGNSSALEALVKEMGRRDVYLVHFWRAAAKIMEDLTGQNEMGIEHAGEFETSFMLAARPDLVKAGERGPGPSISTIGGRTFGKSWFSEEMTETGSFGGANFASGEKGVIFIESCLGALSEIIDEIRNAVGD